MPIRQSRHLAPCSMWLAGIVAAFYPALFSGFRLLQIGPGDPRLVHYILEHSYLWLLGRPHHTSFWSPPAFYPTLNVGAYSDTILGAAPLYWVWRVIGFEVGTSFQLWMMGCLSLNFFAAYLFLTRGLRFGSWPGAAGAFLYGFGISRLSNFNSPQLFPVFFIMLGLLAASRAIHLSSENSQAWQRRGWILGFFAAATLQAWSGFYPAFFFIVIIGTAGILALLFGESKYPPAKPGALVVSRSKRHDVTATRSLAPPKGGYSSNRSCSSRRSSRSCCWTYSRTTRSSCPTVET